MNFLRPEDLFFGANKRARWNLIWSSGGVSKETRKAREKQTAEIFTPPQLVNDVLDKLSECSAMVIWERGKTFCDNSCGNGAFLVEILQRKLDYPMTPLEALNDIYGVELMADNVAECKARLLNLVSQIESVTDAHWEIVNKHIVCADALTYDYSFGEEQ